MTIKGLWMTQAQCQMAAGTTMGNFRSKIMPKLKTRPVKGKKKLEYFLPEDLITDIYKKNNNPHYDEIDDNIDPDEAMVEDILGDITGDSDLSIDPDNIDLNEARRQEVIMRTKYLSQKIEKKKNELFAEWSERFFMIFSKNFAKFKNTLIDLHLEEKQLQKLNENLDLALENMEIGLTEILQEYINDEGTNE